MKQWWRCLKKWSKKSSQLAALSLVMANSLTRSPHTDQLASWFLALANTKWYGPRLVLVRTRSGPPVPCSKAIALSRLSYWIRCIWTASLLPHSWAEMYQVNLLIPLLWRRAKCHLRLHQRRDEQACRYERSVPSTVIEQITHAATQPLERNEARRSGAEVAQKGKVYF